MKIAINGFGRIGRVIARINSEKKFYDLVNINDIIPSINNIAYLFKYDSTYGKFNGSVKVDGKYLNINDKKILYSNCIDITKIPFVKKIDVLIDSSGHQENISLARQLVKSGKIKKYIFTMSSNLVDEEIVVGINDKNISKKSKIFSSSICDANAILHILKLINDKFSILSGSITTLHPWLTYQNLLDGAAKGISPDLNKYTPIIGNNAHLAGNFGLGRSSIGSLIVKETSAVLASEKILKSIRGKIFSFSYRIPTATVASAIIYLNTKKNIEKKDLIKFIRNLAKKKIIKINYEHLISKDYEKEDASAVIDMNYLKLSKNHIQIILWYDNEWGYSSRVLDLIKIISSNK